MKGSSEQFGCILYLSSFSSEYTWVLLTGPNGHWVTPGQPSNTLFKSHNTQAQDLWTGAVKAAGKGGGSKTYFTLQQYIANLKLLDSLLQEVKTAWFTSLRGFVFWLTLSIIELTLHFNDNYLGCFSVRWHQSLLMGPKTGQFVLKINSGFIAAQWALGGHFVFFIINFWAIQLNDWQQHNVTHISFFDTNLWGLLVFALSTN